MIKTISVNCKTFDDLSKNELYRVMALRMAVFCVEQNCPYQDLDGQDQNAIHVFIKDHDTICAYARIIQKDIDCCYIGRVVVARKYRKKGLATHIMKYCIEKIKHDGIQNIELSAQSYLSDFYKHLGFINTGEYYLEDDIPHQHMHLMIR